MEISLFTNLLGAIGLGAASGLNAWIPLLGVGEVHQLGYSSFEGGFCRMIREGKAEREPWQHTFEFLEYTARTGLFVKPLVLDLLAQLGLQAQDVGVRFE